MAEFCPLASLAVNIAPATRTGAIALRAIFAFFVDWFSQTTKANSLKELAVGVVLKQDIRE